MKITAQVHNSASSHEVSVSTAGVAQVLALPHKHSGPGSAVNGGELLMLALATCFCNDVYREAARLGLRVDAVDVEAEAEFPGVGEAAWNVHYRARVVSPEPEDRIAALLLETDALAEVQNTLRAGAVVSFEHVSGQG